MAQIVRVPRIVQMDQMVRVAYLNALIVLVLLLDLAVLVNQVLYAHYIALAISGGF